MMPRIRTLGTTSVLVAATILATSAVASAHPGHHFGPRGFDNVWIGTPEDDAYTAPEDSRDLIIGRAGNDVLDAGNKRDAVRGGPGNDAINGGDGGDRIHGGTGNDRLAGGEGRDRILGGPGDDGINGQAGHDLIRAGAGDDLIVANDGVRDWMSCGPGRDAVRSDRRDRVARNCERVVRVRPVPTDTPDTD